MIHSLGLFGLFLLFQSVQSKKYFQPTLHDNQQHPPCESEPSAEGNSTAGKASSFSHGIADALRAACGTASRDASFTPLGLWYP